MIAHAETKSGKLPSWVENEAFIVRAVNAHDALVEALKNFVSEYVDFCANGDGGFWDAEKDKVVIDARAALALAEAKP
jgi:hypothetical protein